MLLVPERLGGGRVFLVWYHRSFRLTANFTRWWIHCWLSRASVISTRRGIYYSTVQNWDSLDPPSINWWSCLFIIHFCRDRNQMNKKILRKEGLSTKKSQKGNNKIIISHYWYAIFFSEEAHIELSKVFCKRNNKLISSLLWWCEKSLPVQAFAYLS